MLSFVIPVRNEERHLPGVLASIRSACEAAGLEHEVAVVDHGSTDRTAELAAAAGARVLAFAEAPSISSLRNRGVRETSGTPLVFLDGDVSLAPGWGARFREVVRELEANPRLVTGSEVLCPPGAGRLETIWFGVPGRDRAHLNSGHFIVSRQFFEELGGFDERVRTGEDHDLTTRAAAAGATIRPDPALPVYHHGFPSTLGEFFRREMWHGISTFDSPKQARTSIVSLLTFALLGVGVVACVAALVTGAWIWLLAPPAALAATSVAAALRRPRRRAADLPG